MRKGSKYTGTFLPLLLAVSILFGAVPAPMASAEVETANTEVRLTAEEEQAEVPEATAEASGTPETTGTPEVTATEVSETTEVAEKNISLGTQGLSAIVMDYGDTGAFTLDTTSENSVYTAIKDQIAQVTYEYADAVADSDVVLELSGDGSYHTTGFGDAAIMVKVYDDFGVERSSQTYLIQIEKDMETVHLSQSSFSEKSVIFSNTVHTFTADVIGMEGIGEETCGLDFETESTNDDMDIFVTFENGVLTFEVHETGSTETYVWINEKKFTVTIQIKEIKLSGSTAFYMTPGQSKQLSVKNLGNLKVTFKSSNTKVASVTSTGKIKAKKVGNAVIVATVDGHNFGCALSVLTKTRKKVVTKAKYIGTNLTYSQPKRMLSKYYDCSSLVWKCYKLEGKYFGDRYYAPVAAAIARYCAIHGKNVSGNIAKNIQAMKYLPGALTFKPGANNGRYRGIYHVEMFVGYTFEGVKADGTPILGTRWGARDNNYQYGTIWAQP